MPYLGLKALWIGGSTVGMADPAAFSDPAYRVANLVTVLADVVAIGVALALTQPWGRRLPAALVLPPAWVATGLLGTLLVLAPVTAPLAGSTPAGSGSDALDSWVYLLVYGSFIVQGVLLLAAFALYAWSRWGAGLRVALTELPRARGGQAATGLAAVCGALGVLHVGWSLGVTAGLANSRPGRRPWIARRWGARTIRSSGRRGDVAAGPATPGSVVAVTGPGLVWHASLVTWGGYTLALAAWDPR